MGMAHTSLGLLFSTQRLIHYAAFLLVFRRHSCHSVSCPVPTGEEATETMQTRNTNTVIQNGLEANSIEILFISTLITASLFDTESKNKTKNSTKLSCLSLLVLIEDENIKILPRRFTPLLDPWHSRTEALNDPANNFT